MYIFLFLWEKQIKENKRYCETLLKREVCAWNIAIIEHCHTFFTFEQMQEIEKLKIK